MVRVRSLLSVIFLLSFVAGAQVAPIAVDPTTGTVRGTVSNNAGVERQEPRQQPQPAKQEPPGRLEGTVSNVASGEPLKRANVVLMPAEGRPDGSYSTSTDAAGRFAFESVAPGTYRLWADRTGYVRSEYGSKTQGRLGSTISVSPAQEISKLDIRLQPHAVIAGRVTDEEGEPLANVQVQTLMFRYLQGKRTLMPASGASTNDLGEYRIFGLAPGRYYLSAVYRNMMAMPGTVSSNPGNQPDEGYALTYFPGTHDTRTATPVQVHAGRPLSGVDFRLQRVRTARIRGRLTNFKAHPMNRPMIMLTSRGSGFTMFDRNTAMPRADGTFEMRGVAAGAYYLIAQTFDGNERRIGRVAVDVTNADIEGIELSVMPSQEMNGSLRVEGQPPVSPTSIRLMLEPKEFTPFGGGGSAAPKDDGTFVFRNITPDTLRIRAFGPQGPAYVKSIFVGQQEAKDGEITIEAGTTPALSVVVSTVGGQIAGIVKGENQALPQGAAVVLVPSNRQRADLYRQATTDQTGTFTMSTVAPGEYKLFAWDDVESGQWMDPEFLQLHENKGKSVSVRESSKENIELQLLKAQSASSPGQ